MTSLLPPSSTQLERHLEKVLTSITDQPLHIRELLDPARCPAELLPWLAWANSVDDWQESWPEQVKRRVIAISFEVHRYKGTPYALQAALDSLGIKTEVLEWWEPSGSGQPGTMTVTAMLNDNISGAGEGLINAEMLQLITRAIHKTKRGSIHYDIELGLYFEESLALAMGRAKAVGASCLQPPAAALVPGDVINLLAPVAAEHRLTLADCEPDIGALLPATASAGASGRLTEHRMTLNDNNLNGVY